MLFTVPHIPENRQAQKNLFSKSKCSVNFVKICQSPTLKEINCNITRFKPESACSVSVLLLQLFSHLHTCVFRNIYKFVLSVGTLANSDKNATNMYIYINTLNGIKTMIA